MAATLQWLAMRPGRLVGGRRSEHSHRAPGLTRFAGGVKAEVGGFHIALRLDAGRVENIPAEEVLARMRAKMQAHDAKK